MMIYFLYFIVYKDPELAKIECSKKYFVDLSNLMTIPDNMLSVISLQLYSKDHVPDDAFDNIVTSNKIRT